MSNLINNAGLNFSYSSIADVYAVMEEARQNNNTQLADELKRFAEDLEQSGTGVFANESFILRPTRWGMEIVSQKDLESEAENE